MKLISKIYLPLSFLILLSSCEKKTATVDDSQAPIVSVLDKVLYKNTIDKLVPIGMSAEDSIKLVDNYIKSWAQDILLYEKAKENISESQEVKRLVAEYKKSLLVNDYQNGLLQEKVSENPNDSDLKRFYDNNSVLFTLKDEIVKGIYLKIPKESSEVENFKRIYNKKTADAINEIDSKALQNTVAYENFYDYWVNLHEILNNIPVSIDDVGTFLSKNKTINISDSSFVYLLNISEYMISGELAPYEFVKEKTKISYIERQRETFVKELNEDLYNNAIDKGQITFYNKK